MTDVELVTFVFDKIIEQGGCSKGIQSYCGGSNCLYRAPNGRKCVVGWLIPDDKYSSEFEGGDILNSRNAKLRNILIELGYDVHILLNLQKIHDKTFGFTDEQAVEHFKHNKGQLLAGLSQGNTLKEIFLNYVF